MKFLSIKNIAALISFTLLAIADVNAVSCPSIIANNSLSSVVCDITTPTFSITSAGEVGGVTNSLDTVSSLLNSGLISSTDFGASGIYNNGTIGTLNNTNSITTSGNSSIGINNDGHIDVLTNSGSISADDGEAGIVNSGSITTLTNSDSISATGSGIVNSGFITALTNSGSIFSGNGWSGLDNSHGTIGTLTNSGSISGSGYSGNGINNQYGTINALVNNSSGTIFAQTGINNSYGTIGTLTNSGLIYGTYGVFNDQGTITTLVNNSGGVIHGGDSAQGIFNRGHPIETLLNSGSIYAGNNGYGVFTYDPITLLTNTSGGSIYAGNGGEAIYSVVKIGLLANFGSIYAGDGGRGITNYGGRIDVLANYNGGEIFSGANGRGIANYGSIGTFNNSGSIYAGNDGNGLYSDGSVDVLTNTGIISAGAGVSAALYNDVNATIGRLTNLGAIYAGAAGFGINNLGIIPTLDNAQGGNGASPSSTALTYTGNLPENYNIIINSPTSYGQLAGTSVTDSTNFGIYSGSSITARLYTGVLQGLASSNVAGSGSTRTGTYDGMTWTLTETVSTAGSENWDLTFSGISIAQTQSSLNILASKLRGAFSGQVVATNYANMNTYDCDLFDNRGLCVSVGGQQTYVDNPSANQTSTVLTVGYKVSPQIRIGGFLNQSINNHTSSSVDISNRSPLMGLFAVWNQNEDRLGYQLKIANAYQDKDITTTRDAVATSEPGRGKTDLNTQSYVGELSYAFLANEDKTLVRPYAAVRYTRIKQDGYTEETTSAVTAPLTYSALSDRSTAALVGVKLDHKLADNFHLKGSLGVEQDLHHHVDNLRATGVSGLTSENFNDNIKRTRPVASIGAYFIPAKNQRIAGDIYYQQLPFQSTGSTTAYVNYMIGF